MVSFSVLPSTLMALLLASSVFSLTGLTTLNDPFHSIAILTPRQPEQPVCCLKPLPRFESVEDEPLLSFEEWKTKQFHMQAQARAKDNANKSLLHSAGQGNGAGDSGNGRREIPSDDSSHGSPSSAAVSPDNGQATYHPDDLLPPHFRVPITDRFNYANLDCSARVHTAHRSAKSPSSILSSKKDRYMLSPCAGSGGGKKGEKQFVVVELCDDIRIDTVQLANFEFFSGVIKDFTVSVAKTYTTNGEGWTVAGTHRAKNVRGVQSFHPPTSLRDFYRYIRIDFHSHYGNEYYCPVSLLRVYGLTHLEEWKWNMWEAESRAKLEGASAASSAVESSEPVEKPTINTVPVPKSPTSTTPAQTTIHPSPSTREEREVLVSFMDHLESQEVPIVESVSGEAEEISTSPSSVGGTTCDEGSQHPRVLTSSVASKIDSSTSNRKANPASPDTADDALPETSIVASLNSNIQRSPETTQQHMVPVSDSIGITRTRTSVVLPSVVSSVTSVEVSQSSTKIVSSSGKAAHTTHVDDPVSPPFHPAAYNSVSSAVPPSSSSHMIPPIAPPVTTGGESIYRTIMNKLSALEANHTLYAMYVEEQTAGVREVLRRVGEDVGRLEGLGKMQAQMYQRTITEWERQRRRLEIEHGELISRVNYLADEIVLEKRLGIAQLCLLLAVLIFMGLTRGSRGEPFIDHGHGVLNKSVKDWSQRNLNLSGDWFRGQNSMVQSGKPGKTSDFSVLHNLDLGRAVHERTVNTFINDKGVTPKSGKRSRTPSFLRTPTRIRTPAGTVPNSAAQPPLITRTHSAHGAATVGFADIDPIPRSAKRWARTAHLHEVRTKNGGKRAVREDMGEGDVFMGSGNRRVGAVRGGVEKVVVRGDGQLTHMVTEVRRPLSPVNPERLRAVAPVDDGTDNDVWVDTDVEGSEVDFGNIGIEGEKI